eukprot:761082-Hanusia_phi.AAC.8
MMTIMMMMVMMMMNDNDEEDEKKEVVMEEEGERGEELRALANISSDSHRLGARDCCHDSSALPVR